MTLNKNFLQATGLGPEGQRFVQQAYDVLCGYRACMGYEPTEFRISAQRKMRLLAEHIAPHDFKCFGFPVVVHDDVDGDKIWCWAPPPPGKSWLTTENP